ncbi:hypothetical protein LOK49_LG01G01626 [Camellia lanceoleosa]|uniref:Uncharacterized protein n=1 Tax=Camellia lanceoleosa TaxID=1840588 RepID=A0ACC0IXZ5_9ERIC|nr:hypothetical protein LOK49_LG01G01626 [Camellia lanceoleosa]
MSNIESREIARHAIGLIVLFTAIFRLVARRFAPYIECAGLLLIAIWFLEIATMFLPVSWLIFPAAAGVLLSYAFIQAIFRLWFR